MTTAVRATHPPSFLPTQATCADSRFPHRELLLVDDAQLRQHTCVIPIEMLAGDFLVLDCNDADHTKLNVLAGCGNARNYPVHLPIMGEAEDRLFGKNVIADDLRDERWLDIGRELGKKLVVIIFEDSIAASSANPNWDH
jgi:hypothetical protein